MSHLFQTLKNDWSISATVAGFLAVLISYSGPLIIFFQAAQQAQVSPDMMISWIWEFLLVLLSQVSFCPLNTKCLWSPLGLHLVPHCWSHCFPILP